MSSPVAQADQEFVVIEAGFEFLSLLLQPPKARIMGMHHYAGLNVRDECVMETEREERGGRRRERTKTEAVGERKKPQVETQTRTLVQVCWSVTPLEEEEKYQNKWRP